MSLIQSNWRSADDAGGQLLGQLSVRPELPQAAEQPAQYESIQDLLAVLKKYRVTVLAVALGVFLLVLLVCLIMTPKYASTAIIEVNRDATAAANAGGGGPGDIGTQIDDVQTEVATDTNILQDSTLALEVIRKLDLANHRPFNKAIPAEEAGLPLDQAPITRDKFIKLFEKSLKVEAIPATRLIQVTFRNPDPVVAANVVNTLSDLFISDYLRRRVDSTSAVSFWIGKELATLKKQVEDSEQALADYEHKTGLVGVDMATDQAGNGLAMQAHNSVLDRLNSLNQELTTAEANRISAEAVYKLIQTQDPEVVLGLGSMGISSGGTVLGQGGGLDLLRNLRAQEIPLKTEYADSATKFGAKNPRLIQLHNQIDALDGEIKNELKKISKRAENDYLYAKSNENAILAQLKVQKVAADKLTDDTVQLQVLAQEAFSNRKLYENLFSQLHQANVTAGIRATHLGVVDSGQVSGLPVIPNYLITLPIAAMAGIILGVVTAFVRKSLDQSVTVPQDVEDAVQLPVMAHLPLFADGKVSLPLTPGSSVLIATPELPLSEAFRSLRTSILLSRPASKNKVLLITSPLPGDGKSTVAFNLAVAFAQQNIRVLLIDGDMRNADLHRHFGGSNRHGLSGALGSQAKSLEGLLTQHSAFETLYLLPAGAKPFLTIELFSSVTFDRLLTEARANFDWIVIDSPPFLPFSDAAVLSSKVDAVLPVIRSGVTSRSMLTTITTLLQRMRAPVIGFVLNGVKEEANPFYSYGYQRKQGKAKYAEV
jgi:succinoglycan biosynthesis transport protein ExoP